MVRRREGDGLVSVDPFDGMPLTGSCDVKSKNDTSGSLWDQTISYQKTALLPPLVTDRRAKRLTMWQAQPEQLSTRTRVLYLQARGFHTREGDTWRLQLTAPDGSLFRDRTDTQYKTQQRMTIALAVARPSGGFMTGAWQATIRLERDGTILGEKTSVFEIVR